MMSFGLGKRRLAGAATLLATALLFGVPGRAQASDPNQNSGVTVDKAGAILVFPKVVFSQERRADGTLGPLRDTVIQISNTMNVTALARCYYVDSRLSNPDNPPHPVFNPRLWLTSDFAIALTRQQPTHWVVSLGRPVNPSDQGLQNGGFDPGGIPPVAEGFEGELKCIVVDSTNENPLPMANWLKGEATIRSDDFDVSSYNAIAIPAGERASETGRELLLDEVGKDNGGQYKSCPDTLLLNFFAFGLDSPVLRDLSPNQACAGGDCPIETVLTLVPCSQDFENLEPGRVTVNFEIFDEFENRISGNPVTVECWLNEALSQLGSNAFNAGVLASQTGYARITSVDGQGGVLGIAEETHYTATTAQARAAFNLQHQGARAGTLEEEDETGPEVTDTIILSAP
jgi:hypothetical protein